MNGEMRDEGGLRSGSASERLAVKSEVSKLWEVGGRETVTEGIAAAAAEESGGGQGRGEEEEEQRG